MPLVLSLYCTAGAVSDHEKIAVDGQCGDRTLMAAGGYGFRRSGLGNLIFQRSRNSPGDCLFAAKTKAHNSSKRGQQTAHPSHATPAALRLPGRFRSAASRCRVIRGPCSLVKNKSTLNIVFRVLCQKHRRPYTWPATGTLRGHWCLTNEI